MGDFGNFLGAFMGPVNQQLEERHKKAEALKDEQRKIQSQTYQDVLGHPERYDPAIYPELAKQASDALGKLYSPEARKGLNKIQPIIQKFQGLFGGGQKQQGADQKMPAPQLPSQAQGAPAQSAQQALGSPDLSKFSTARLPDPVQFRRAKEWEEIENEEDPEKRDQLMRKASFLETGKVDFPKTGPLSSRKLVDYKLSDGSIKHVTFDPKTGLFYDRTTRQLVQIPDSAVQQANPANVRPISLGAQAVLTKDQMIEQMHLGNHLLDPNGNLIAPEALSDSPNVVYQELEVSMPEGKTEIRYVPRNINDNKYVWENGVYLAPPTQLPAIASGQSQPQPVGRAQVGFTGTHEVTEIGPDGQPIAVPLTSTRTPGGGPTPGAQQALPPPQVQQPRPGQGAPGTPQGPQSVPGTAPQSRQPGGSSPSGAPQPRAGGRPLPGMPVGQATQQENQAASLTGVMGTLFGDPEYPNFKSLTDYAYLADKPDSRRRIAQAVDVVQRLGDEGSPDGAAISAGPVHVGFGAAGDWVNWFTGLPKLASGAKVDAIHNMMAELAKHPDEVEAFNAFMTANADIIALRSLTKSSPALANARAIRAELANMMTAADSKAFKNSLSRTAQLMQKGVQFNRFIKPGIRQRLDEVLGGKKGEMPTKGAEKKLSSPKDEELKKKLNEIF